jgi:hypothetical protein
MRILNRRAGFDSITHGPAISRRQYGKGSEMPSFVLGSPRDNEQFFTNLITAIDDEEPDQIKINGKLIVDNITRLVTPVPVAPPFAHTWRTLRPGAARRLVLPGLGFRRNGALRLSSPDYLFCVD